MFGSIVMGEIKTLQTPDEVLVCCVNTNNWVMHGDTIHYLIYVCAYNGLFSESLRNDN